MKVSLVEHYDGDKNLLFVIIYDVTDELNMKEKTSALTLGFYCFDSINSKSCCIKWDIILAVE